MLDNNDIPSCSAVVGRKRSDDLGDDFEVSHGNAMAEPEVGASGRRGSDGVSTVAQESTSYRDHSTPGLTGSTSARQSHDGDSSAAGAAGRGGGHGNDDTRPKIRHDERGHSNRAEAPAAMYSPRTETSGVGYYGSRYGNQRDDIAPVHNSAKKGELIFSMKGLVR